ncbi:MAG: ATP-binding protein, partial [Planctomycetota bacterium]
FNARSLPDPGDPRAIERPSGRGLVLIRNFMDEVSFNEAGNCVTMSKRHRAVKIPKPILFNTPEADQILGQTDLLSPGSPWRECITERPVHPSSDKIIASIGSDRGMGANLDMGFAIIPPTQKPVEIRLMDAALAAQSDKGALPIPDNAPIEGWPLWPPGVPLEELQRQGRGSRRVIVVDPARKMLYELAGARRVDTGWEASQASVWNLGSGESRPTGWISADGAGLPIFPGVVRYDEVQRGMVEHAIRVTVKKTRREAVHPASHADSMYTSGQLPRMGERFRLRASFDISGFSPHVQAILKGLKHYGMIVADHGYDWHISVAPDARIEGLEELGRVTGSDFEAIVPSPAPEGRRPEAQLAQPMQARVRTVAAPQAGRSVSAERAAE